MVIIRSAWLCIYIGDCNGRHASTLKVLSRYQPILAWSCWVRVGGTTDAWMHPQPGLVTRGLRRTRHRTYGVPVRHFDVDRYLVISTITLRGSV